MECISQIIPLFFQMLHQTQFQPQLLQNIMQILLMEFLLQILLLLEPFEGVGIGTTNTGYVLIGDEVIEYTNITGNTIGGNIVRGTNARTYPIGTPIRKYELAGVNLKRVNKPTIGADVTDTDPFTFDSYKIKIDTSEKFNDDNEDRSVDTSYPKLYFNETKNFWWI